MEYVTLNTGAKIPLEGFGVFQIPDRKQCEEVIYNAIKVGYRFFDTAAAYFNEEAVGKAIARAIADGLTIAVLKIAKYQRYSSRNCSACCSLTSA